MAKFYDIDPETCSIEELKEAILKCDEAEKYYNTMQISAKKFINSVYGVFGTSYFNLSNTDIAESITLQGQDLIKYSVIQINDYFNNIWNNDIEVHKKIAQRMKEKYPDFDVDMFLTFAKCNTLSINTLQIYGDTDSAYVTLQPVIDACHIPIEQQTDFDIAVYDFAMEEYLNNKFEEYAKLHNCKKNLEKFELEKISRTILSLAKKNYMCDVAWLDSGERCDPLTHVTYTGFDVVKGSTPPFVRTELKRFTEFVLGKFNNGVKPTQGEIVQKMREIKTRFSMQHPNDISKGTSISDYEKFVKDEKGKAIEYFSVGTDKDRKLAVPIHVRAAAVYNNMLFTKAKRYMSKYSIIHSGDKVKYYYINEDDVFGFVPDRFPAEFAPPMDIDIQFDKMLLSPMNRIVVAMGYNEIPPTLTYTTGLF